MVGAGYQSAYEQLPSLRPELKLELIQRDPLLPTETRRFGYLYEGLAGIPFASPATIDCISIAETAAEKVISLLRRCAWKWDGHQRGDMDAALVRHVYDVARIAESAGNSLGAARAIFPQLVMNDRDEFKGQHPGFDDDPVGVLKRTLTTLRTASCNVVQTEDCSLPKMGRSTRIRAFLMCSSGRSPTATKSMSSE